MHCIVFTSPEGTFVLVLLPGEEASSSSGCDAAQGGQVGHAEVPRINAHDFPKLLQASYWFCSLGGWCEISRTSATILAMILIVVLLLLCQRQGTLLGATRVSPLET